MNRDNIVEKACALSDLLEGKLVAFKSFLSATVLLKDAADLQEMGKIQPLIAKRESCINVIKGIDSRINRIRNSISMLPGEAIEKIKTLKKAIDTIAAEAAHLNKEFETMLILHRDNTKKQLSNICQSRNGVKGYAAGYAAMARGGNQPKFLDVTS